MIRLIQRRLIIPRGDTGSFTIPYLRTKSEGDVAVFTIFDCLTHTKMYQKVIAAEGDVLNIAFTHNDTVNLKPGKYLWDIKFYANPQFLDDELVNGDEVDSYYAGYSLPQCEIRETADNYLISPDAPSATLSPIQLDIITHAIESLNDAVEKTQENVEHYPEIRDEVWYVWDAELGDFVSTGVRANGIVGNGIESAVLNDDYTLTLNFTDGTSYTSPSIRGNGIDDIVLNNDFTLTISYTDGESYTTPSIRGATGASGVYYGTTEPTDPEVNVWINPEGASWNDTIKQEILADIPENRVTSLNATPLVSSTVIEAVGTPIYVEDITQYSDYNISNTGWYVFARISVPDGNIVDINTTITGAAGYIATIGNTYVDVAVRFEVAAESQTVTIVWNNVSDTFIFKATDLAIRNLDYRTTFYIYDIAPYTTWTYVLTSDTTFISGNRYFIENNGAYVEVIEGTDWIVGDSIPENTYYKHKNVTFSGMVRNITYKCDEIIDCPQIYILPEIEEDIHGCWYEIRLRHAGSYSSTLQVPDGVKVATEHTQAETAGLNMVDLHYSNVGGVKLWRFLNTHSTIPS